MNSAVVLTVLALLVVVAAGWRALHRLPAARAEDLCRSFGLDPARYRVLGADVGNFATPFGVQADGLIGRPDAVFISCDRAEVIIGEVKSRHHRGRITEYERYQMTLYLGAVRQRFRHQSVRGLLRFHDVVIDLRFEERTYQHLLSLIPEYRRARESWT
jgi:hypothetical protein